jgi:hypothetical protein
VKTAVKISRARHYAEPGGNVGGGAYRVNR